METRNSLWDISGKKAVFFKKLVAWITLATFMGQPALAAAQAVADPNAAANNKPKVETAQNGVPVVQITAPTAAGVSRNLYTTLNVDPQGLILNNSRIVTQTQLGGHILGNTNLTGGSARVILNEVTGTGASQLKGYIEVAGQRAEVIIANPNGIVVNGGGFINTSRAVLTTGTPIFGGSGSLEAFRVAGGMVTVEGAGLDASTADRVDLISRAVQVNAGVWGGKELNVVTGANQVNNSDLSTTKITGDGAAPAVSLDVAALGGMYAGKIRLIGTEAGVGVNSQGALSATTGDLTLTQEGKIVLAGATSASGNIAVNTASDFTHQGTLYAGGNANISAAVTLTNTGVIAAAQNTTVAAQSISSIGTLAAGINSDGTIGTSGDLSVIATGTIAATGKNLAGGSLTATGASVDLSGATTYAGGNASLTSTTGDVNNTGGIVQAGSTLTINAAGTLKNDKGAGGNAAQMVAGSVTLSAANVSNKGGQIAQTGTGTLRITATGSLDDTSGKILTNGKLAIQAGQITNPNNDMVSSGDITISTVADFTNQGLLSAGGTLLVSAPNVTNAAAGVMNAGTTTITATSSILNDGRIEGNQVTTTSQSLANKGTILGDTVTVNAASVTNQGSAATIAATGTINLWVTDSLTNQNGANITSLGDINIAANNQTDANGYLVNRTQQITNTAATIEAGANMNIAAETVVNAGGAVQVNTDTTQPSTITRTQIPHMSHYLFYTEEDGSVSYGARPFSGGRGNVSYFDYGTLYLTVPKGNVISYDASQKKLVFNDVTNTSVVLVYGPNIYNEYMSVSEFNNLMRYREPEERARYKVLPAYSAFTFLSREWKYVASPTWTGKESGKTTAYCNNVTITANGDYVIDFFPGYDPKIYLSPAESRYWRVNRGDDHGWELWRSVTTTVTTESLNGTPVSGKLRVGQNLKLNIGQQFINKYSDVNVGNAVTGNITNLVNQGYALKQTTKTTEQTYCLEYYDGGRPADALYNLGPYYSTTDIDSGLRSTFTAKTISLTGANVSNIQVRPDGTPGPQVGSTVTAPAAPSTSGQVSVPSGSTQTVPQSGLYTIHPEATANYLVETNPRFANYQTFVSSDFMLQKLSLDPTKTTKRLGDGFYEQKLVTDQIAQLTGRRFLTGYTDNNTEFKALMNNGLAAAQALQLVPGVALTKEQIAALTQDIVWMVEQDITLANGQTQKALVPVVYLCQTNSLKLTTGGALIAADTVNINVSGNVNNGGMITGTSGVSLQAANILNGNAATISSSETVSLNAVNDIVNNGTVSGKQVVVVAGRDVKNETVTSVVSANNNSMGYAWTGTNTLVGQQATIQATGDLTVNAGRDVSMQGASLKATGNATVEAGRNLDVATVTAQTQGTTTGSGFLHTHSETTNVVSSISSGSALTVTSGGNATFSGAQVSAGGNMTIAAQGDLTVTAVKDTSSVDLKVTGKTSSDTLKSYDETVVGGSLQGGGNVSVVSDQGSVTVAGSSVTSQSGGVAISGKTGVAIQEVSEKHELETEHHSSKKGFFSSSRKDTYDYSLTNLVKGSSVSGNTVSVTSGSDLTVKGSSVVGTNDVSLAAQGNVKITSAQETSQEEHYKFEKTSGIFSGGGFGITIGSRSQKSTLDMQGVTQVASTVGSISGNVNITAGKDAKVTASDVISGKDTHIQGQNVTVEAATNTSNAKQTYEFKQSGLTIALSSPAIDTLTTVANKVERATQVQDSRLATLYAVSAARDLNGIAGKIDKTLNGKTAEDGSGKKTTDISISISIGSSSSKSETVSQSSQARGASVTAGSNVNITATGSGATDAAGKAADGNVNVAGSTVNGQNVSLTAAKDVNLTPAANTSVSNTISSSSSLGVGVSLGAQTGVFIQGSKGNGNENENSTTHTQAVVTASSTLTTTSGSDTNIVGGQAKGNTVNMTVGGNLNIASQQDADNYNSRSSSVGGTIGIGMPSSVSASKGKTDSTYSSVTAQSGVYAGTGGFNINVGANTDLKGAVIASDATPDKNKLSTNTLTWSDIQNNASYSASSSGFGYSWGNGPLKNSDGTIKTDSNGKPVDNPANGFSYSPSMPVSGKADSTTKSAIASGVIEVRSNPNVDLSGLSRDTSGALNALGKIFDKKNVQERQELANLFSQEAFKAVGDLSQREWEKAVEDAKNAKKIGNKDAYEEAQQRIALWDDGGAYKIALHAFVGGLAAQIGGGSFASGASGAGLNEALQGELGKIKNSLLHQLASAAVGAIAAKLVGGDAQTGAIAALNGTKYNWQNGHDKKYSPAAQAVLLELTALYYAAEGDPEEQARIAQKADEVRYKLENNLVAEAIDIGSTWISSIAATNSIFGSSSRAERDAILAEVRQYEPGIDAGDNQTLDNIFFVAGFAVPVTKANLLFQTGRAAEGHLLGEVGGVAQKYFLTSLGGRFVDVFSNGVAYESKVGYVPLTDFVKKQVLKDAELLNNPNSGVNAVEWNFYRSGITGKIGPSQPLLDFLDQHGIKYVIHD